MSTSRNMKACDYCCIKLDEPYIKCAVCADTTICLQCFASGREWGTHENDHAYIVIEANLSVFPGAKGDWLEQDELELLAVMGQVRRTDWQTIANALTKPRTADECREHYYACYFGGAFQEHLPHIEEIPPASEPHVIKMPTQEPPRHDYNTPDYIETAGYQCATGYFARPYDHTAEALIESINEQSVQPATTASIKKLAIGVAEAYRNRLRERKRRYKLIRDHGLIKPYRVHAHVHKCREIMPKRSTQQFFGLSRLCDPEEFDVVIETLRYRATLKNKLKRLLEARRHGVRSLLDAEVYFALRRQRGKEKVALAKGYVTGDKWLSALARLNTINTRYSKSQQLDISKFHGYSTLSQDEQKLCSLLKMTPKEFVAHKAMLMQKNKKRTTSQMSNDVSQLAEEEEDEEESGSSYDDDSEDEDYCL